MKWNIASQSTSRLRSFLCGHFLHCFTSFGSSFCQSSRWPGKPSRWKWSELPLAVWASAVGWLIILKRMAGTTGGALLGGCCKWVGSWWCGLEHSPAWFKSLGRWLCAHFQPSAGSCTLLSWLGRTGSPETLMWRNSLSLHFPCSISWHCRWAACGNGLQAWNLQHLCACAYFFVSGSGLRIFRICSWSGSVLWFALFPLALLLGQRSYLATWSVHGAIVGLGCFSYPLD